MTTEAQKASHAAFRKRNREKVNAWSARWRANNKDKIRAINAARPSRAKNPGKPRSPARPHRLRRHRLSWGRYYEMLAIQGGVCKICLDPFDAEHIDHDHSTGAVRGILCRRCNVGLGLFRDNPALLVAAAKYLDYKKC